LNTPASELISAASRPATTMPRTPAGSTVATRSGKAFCAWSRISSPLASNNTCWIAGTLPLAASAKQMMPGMMKMKTGSSLSPAAKMEPRRASCSPGAPSARWTMYISMIEPIQKLSSGPRCISGNRTENTIPPAKIATAILVST